MNNLHLQMNNKPQAIGQKQAIPGKHANNIQKVKLFNFTNCQRNTNEDQHQTICKQTKRNSGKSEQQNKRKGSVLFSNLLEQNQMFSYSLTSCKKQHRDQHEGIVSSVLPCHAGILNHSARSQLQVLCFQSNFLPMHTREVTRCLNYLGPFHPWGNLANVLALGYCRHLGSEPVGKISLSVSKALSFK